MKADHLISRDFGKFEVGRPPQTGKVAANPVFKECPTLQSALCLN